MLVYNHKLGWDEDTSISDEWETNDDDLVYPGYESIVSETIGLDFGNQVTVYRSKDIKADYQFFVCLSMTSIVGAALVDNFVGLIKLINEFAPVIELCFRQEKHDAFMEEHKWKVEEMGKQRECAH